MRFCSRMILFALGYWWIWEDGVYDPNCPVIVSNHVSFADPFYFAWAMLPMAVAKAEVLKAPFLGTIAKAQQTILVHRGSAQSRHDVSVEISRRTQWKVKAPEEVRRRHGDWPPLLIFPEATCTNSKSVIEFKYGAFAPLMPVQPVVLDFRQNYLDVSWVGRCPVALTVIRMMCQLYNTLQVRYLPVHVPNPGETVPLFALRVRASIAATLGVPMTDHNFLDAIGKRDRAAEATEAAEPAAKTEQLPAGHSTAGPGVDHVPAYAGSIVDSMEKVAVAVAGAIQRTSSAITGSDDEPYAFVRQPTAAELQAEAELFESPPPPDESTLDTVRSCSLVP
jgi:hypothetical protein